VLGIALALAIGAAGGFVIGHRRSHATRSLPVAASVRPAVVEVCGRAATVTAPVAVGRNETLTIRLVRVGTRHELRIDVVTPRRGDDSFRGGFAVPPFYDAPRSSNDREPIVGEHIVRVERADELLAVGRVTVVPEDPSTPTTCHSAADALAPTQADIDPAHFEVLHLASPPGAMSCAEAVQSDSPEDLIAAFRAARLAGQGAEGCVTDEASAI
jgi:hypothetical protein